jgi:SAM-dependent methyltransferase
MCHDLGYEISGVEVSPTALKKAEDFFAEKGVEFCGKLLQPPALPFGDARFSLVYSLQALYYNLDLEEMVSEIDRILCPGGAIYVSFFTPEHWYFRHSKPIDQETVRWADDHPTEGLRGLTLRYFESKSELARIFSNFENLRVDDFMSNMLGIDFHLWLVTGMKKGGNATGFDMIDHYSKVGKP